jgi:hypothetical protein
MRASVKTMPSAQAFRILEWFFRAIMGLTKGAPQSCVQLEKRGAQSVGPRAEAHSGSHRAEEGLILAVKTIT